MNVWPAKRCKMMIINMLAAARDLYIFKIDLLHFIRSPIPYLKQTILSTKSGFLGMLSILSKRTVRRMAHDWGGKRPNPIKGISVLHSPGNLIWLLSGKCLKILYIAACIGKVQPQPVTWDNLIRCRWDNLGCSTLVCLLVQQGFINAPVMSRRQRVCTLDTDQDTWVVPWQSHLVPVPRMWRVKDWAKTEKSWNLVFLHDTRLLDLDWYFGHLLWRLLISQATFLSYQRESSKRDQAFKCGNFCKIYGEEERTDLIA